MQIENDIMKIQLEGDEVKKLLADYDKLRHKLWPILEKAKKEGIWRELPYLDDLMNSIQTHSINRGAITKRKLNEHV